MKSTKKALRWIVQILRKHKIPYQISGGFAAKIYGSRRKLADIDIEISEEDFKKIIPELEKYIQFGPKKYKDKNWDLLLMTIKYKGQLIDFGGAYKTKIFYKKTKRWINLRSDFSKSEMKKIYGTVIPVIPKTSLLKYKKMLSRKVDKLDFINLEKSNT